MSRRPGKGALCLVVGLAAGPAFAGEVLRSDDGSRVLEASASLKPYGSWLVMPRGLVDATAELGRALDETRAQLPPAYAGQLPDDVTLPEQVGLSTWTGRLSTRLVLLDSIEIEAAWQAAAILSTSTSFGAGATQAGALGTTLVTPQRRLIDFDPYLIDQGALRLQHNLDRLLVRWQTSELALTVGRQAVSWGTGRLWNPTDLLSPFAPTDVDREVRRGADAVRLSLPIDEVTQLDLLWLPQQQLAEQGFVVRLATNVFQTDVSGSAAKYVDDLVLGADAAGDLGPLGVHGEVAWTLPVVGEERDVESVVRSARVGDAFVRAVAGLDWRPSEAWVLSAEYYFNGFGTDDQDRIVAKLGDPRVVRGEVFGAGRHYAGVVASWLANELLSVSATAIVNLTDPGALLVPALEYSIEQSVLLRVGAFVPLAEGVDVDLFRALGPADVIGDTDAFRRATTTLGARSEYGLNPAGVFVQLGAYFE